jgi:ribulose-phosphate 3-epimerase
MAARVRSMIGPSLLACDLTNMASESMRVLTAGADFLHLDVMDGHFVPNITFGAPVICCLKKNVTNAIFDVHLMVTNPEKWVNDMAIAGATYFTFHVEIDKSEDEKRQLIQDIKSHGMKVGLAIKPKTPVESVFPFIELLDLVLVMTVEPGFGGQKFMMDMMPKVQTLRQLYPSLDIEVDGGLAPDTIEAAASAGANWIVAGSAVFKGDPVVAIAGLKE